jgi:hypothetical protein
MSMNGIERGARYFGNTFSVWLFDAICHFIFDMSDLLTSKSEVTKSAKWSASVRSGSGTICETETFCRTWPIEWIYQTLISQDVLRKEIEKSKVNAIVEGELKIFVQKLVLREGSIIVWSILLPNANNFSKTLSYPSPVQPSTAILGGRDSSFGRTGVSCLTSGRVRNCVSGQQSWQYSVETTIVRGKSGSPELGYLRKSLTSLDSPL